MRWRRVWVFIDDDVNLARRRVTDGLTELSELVNAVIVREVRIKEDIPRANFSRGLPICCDFRVTAAIRIGDRGSQDRSEDDREMTVILCGKGLRVEDLRGLLVDMATGLQYSRR
jgi:hypothetical protein